MIANGLEPHTFNDLLSFALSSIESTPPREIPIPAKLALLEATQLLLSGKNINVNANLLLQTLYKIATINPFDDLIQISLTCEGINQLQEFRELRNRIAIAYNIQGNAFYQQGHIEQAAIHYQKALQIGEHLSPSDLLGIYFNAGMAWFVQGQPEKAQQIFQQALQIQPNLIQVQQMLVRVNYQLETKRAGYKFSQDWFSRNLGIWQENLMPFSNQPNLNILEIGSWEGRSTCWLLNNILTHPSSRITCIDTFEGGGGTPLEARDGRESIEAQFDFNIALTESAEKVTKLVNKSRAALRLLPFNSFDIIYIDGSHLACDVLEDTLLSWGLLKIRGLIIFDDYDHVFRELPNQNTKIGIDAFMASFCNKIQLIHQSHQIIIKKMED
ncbi:MAG TPA: class I SAM-dependent methyltransferase [Kamptonema sp.]|nr:class I SAM-dependent methyltransferase [Kamptonema sp.]